MKKAIKYLVFSLLMLFGFSLNVNAETLPAAVDGKITLDKDYTIDSVTFDASSDVTVLDLNGKTITLNGMISIEKGFEIKNGTIKRTVEQVNDAMILVSSNDKGTVNIKNLVVDGTVVTTHRVGHGISIVNNSTAVLDGVTLKGHKANYEYAGALFIMDANSVIVKNSEVFENSAPEGPGMHPHAGAIRAENLNNFELINTNVHDNNTLLIGNVYIKNVKNFNIDKDTVIKNNIAGTAAGLYVADSVGTISATIEGNKSNKDNAGGIYTIFTVDSPNSVITITKDAKIVNNESALGGGGLYVNANRTNMPGKVIINGATITGNKSLGTVDASDGLYKDIGGGAISVARGILEINDIKMSGNTASAKVGNGIVVSHANGNANGGKLTVNGGTFGDTIDLGVGSIVVNGGTFKQDMAKYITNTKLISKKTTDGYEVVENKVLENDNVTFENESAMDSDLELVITDKSDTLKDEKVETSIKEVIEEEVKAETKDEKAKVKDVEVLALYDISVSDGTNTVEMKDGKFKITVNIDEDLLVYDNYAGIYIDDEGNVSYLPVEVKDGKATIETSHLSTYGIVGYNNVVEEEVKNPETVVNVEMIISLILFGLMITGIGISMKKQNA